MWLFLFNNMIDELLNEIGDRFFDTTLLTTEEKNRIKRVYKKVTGNDLKECGACYARAYETLKSKKSTYMNVSSQFKLKQGKVIRLHSLHMVISEKNLTDHNVLMLLKKNPNAIAFFEKYPSDWREQADKYEANKTVEKPSEEPVKQELEAEVVEVKEKAIEKEPNQEPSLTFKKKRRRK